MEPGLEPKRPLTTPRQAEVVALIRQGLGTKEIALRLGVSSNAVKAHVTKLLRKFHVSNRAALVEVLASSVTEERTRLSDLVRNTPVRIVVTRGPEHRVEWANRAWLRAVAEAQAFGRPIADLDPALATAGDLAARDEVLRTGRGAAENERLILRPTGDGGSEASYLTIVHEPLRDERGDVDGILSFVIDVTGAVRERQQALGLSADQRAVLDLLPSGIVITDAEGRYLLNRKALALFGRSGQSKGTLRETMPSPAFTDASTGKPPSFDETVLGLAFAGECASRTYVVRREPEQGDLWLRASAAPLRDENEAIRAAVAVFDDVSDQERFGRAFAAAPFPMALAGPELRLVAANTAFARRFGRTVEELAAVSLDALLAAADAETLRYLTARAVAGEIATFKLEGPFRGGERRARVWRLSATPLAQGSSGPSYILLSLAPPGTTSGALGSAIPAFLDPTPDLPPATLARLTRTAAQHGERAAVAVVDFHPVASARAMAVARRRVTEIVEEAVTPLPDRRLLTLVTGREPIEPARALRRALEGALGDADGQPVVVSVGLAMVDAAEETAALVRRAAAAAYVARLGALGVLVYRIDAPR